MRPSSGTGPHRNPAYGAFEMALFDLVGLGVGGARALAAGLLAVRDRVPADYWIGQENPADAGRNARRGQERGFHGMKLKCAVDDPWEERVGAILEACGPDFKLTLDPNERFYRPAEAIALAKRLERFPNIALYQDPMPKWNLDWYRQFRAAVTAPVALHLAHPRDVVLAIKAEACDHFNLAGSMVQFVRSAVHGPRRRPLLARLRGGPGDHGALLPARGGVRAQLRPAQRPRRQRGAGGRPGRRRPAVRGRLRGAAGDSLPGARAGHGRCSSAMRSPDGRTVQVRRGSVLRQY